MIEMDYINFQNNLSTKKELKKHPAPELLDSAYRLEVSSAFYLFHELSLADMAHIIMLMEKEIVPQQSGSQLLKALLKAHDIPLSEFPLELSQGDFYNCRESYLHQIAPESAGWQRVARARREATNIAFLMAVRERLVSLMESHENLANVFLQKSEEHIHTLMPDYTYLQQAQPTTFAHYLLGFVYPLKRDLSRLRGCFERINRSPGGLGSVNGSRLPIDRERLAELLGFDGIIPHTRDAMWQADMPGEVSSCASTLQLNIDRLAEDLQIWNTGEFDFIQLDEKYCRDSVIMPQKKNPYSLTYLRGLTNMSINHSAAMSSLGRTPSGQPDNRIFAYVELPSLLDKTIQAVRLMEGIIRSLKVNKSAMLEKFKYGYSQATDLAEVIMLETKLCYRRAHKIVQKVVKRAAAENVPAEAISTELIDQIATEVLGYPLNIPAQTIVDALDPKKIVSTRQGVGGASEKSIQKMMKDCRDEIKEFQKWRQRAQARMNEAEEKLIKLARNKAKSG